MLKQYVDEPGSPWLRAQTGSAALSVSSQLLVIEIVSAFNRRVREASLSLAEYQRVRDVFREDCRTTYQIVSLTAAVVDLACALLERHPMRGYDSVHLATALTVQQSLQRRGLPALTFLSADNRLNDAASAEGLTVDNPNEHL